MSCYVVEDKTICTIASALCDIVNDELPGVFRNYLRTYELKNACEPFSKDGKIDYKKMCYMLHGLNCRAFGYRYVENEIPMLTITRKRNTGILISDNIQQLYKTIRCYLYQCSESSEIVNDPVFKACETLCNTLAWYHMEKSSKYDQADWG